MSGIASFGTASRRQQSVGAGSRRIPRPLVVTLVQMADHAAAPNPGISRPPRRAVARCGRLGTTTGRPGDSRPMTPPQAAADAATARGEHGLRPRWRSSCHSQRLRGAGPTSSHCPASRSDSCPVGLGLVKQLLGAFDRVANRNTIRRERDAGAQSQSTVSRRRTGLEGRFQCAGEIEHDIPRTDRSRSSPPAYKV